VSSTKTVTTTRKTTRERMVTMPTPKTFLSFNCSYERNSSFGGGLYSMRCQRAFLHGSTNKQDKRD